MRIGEVAEAVGTTSRTIRYYEEIGLLGAAGERESGKHRTYTEQDVERLRDALRLKELLGLSLEELRELLEAQDARAALRDEWHHGQPGPARRATILEEAARHLDRQLELVARRRAEIQELEVRADQRRARVRELLASRASLPAAIDLATRCALAEPTDLDSLHAMHETAEDLAGAAGADRPQLRGRRRAPAAHPHAGAPADRRAGQRAAAGHVACCRWRPCPPSGAQWSARSTGSSSAARFTSARRRTPCASATSPRGRGSARRTCRARSSRSPCTAAPSASTSAPGPFRQALLDIYIAALRRRLVELPGLGRRLLPASTPTACSRSGWRRTRMSAMRRCMESQPAELRRILRPCARRTRRRLAGRRILWSVWGRAGTRRTAARGARCTRDARSRSATASSCSATPRTRVLDAGARARPRDRRRRSCTSPASATAATSRPSRPSSPTRTPRATRARCCGSRRSPALGRSSSSRDPRRRRRVLDLPGPLIEVPQRLVELIGAGPNAWTAQEGALKIREASYVAAEGLSSEQFFHGPSVALDAQDTLVASTAAARSPTGRRRSPSRWRPRARASCASPSATRRACRSSRSRSSSSESRSSSPRRAASARIASASRRTRRARRRSSGRLLSQVVVQPGERA